MNILFTLIAFALALGILIVIHELGHYWVARLSGVKVLRFSIGFGKPLLVKRYGADQTEWAIAAFPLGGYVKMLDEREGKVSPHEVHRAFNRQAVSRRVAIVAAGPIANLLLAIVLYWVLFMHGVPGIKPVLGEVPKQTAASVSDLKKGDLILNINSQPVVTWQDVRWYLLQDAVQKSIVKIEVQNAKGELGFHTLDMSHLTAEDLDGDLLEKLGLSIFRPEFTTRIGQILPDGASAQAGLQEGDVVVSINQSHVQRWEELVEWVRKSPGLPLQFSLDRHGKVVHLTVVPDGALEKGSKVGKIGAGPWVDPSQKKMLLTQVKYSPLRAFQESVSKTWDTAQFSLKMLFKMATGEVSLKNISGPITIADIAGQTASLGFVPYVSFLALISISLGVLNLLPIPLLDGGHLLYYMVEIIKGSPVSERVMEIGQQIGMAFLLTLMAFAFYNDINRLLIGS